MLPLRELYGFSHKSRQAFIDRVQKQLRQQSRVGLFQQQWQAGRIFSRTLARLFMFCVNERLLALWNQHVRFQLLCQPTICVEEYAAVRSQVYLPRERSRAFSGSRPGSGYSSSNAARRSAV